MKYILKHLFTKYFFARLSSFTFNSAFVGKNVINLEKELPFGGYGV
jgi:hypothetical protein